MMYAFFDEVKKNRASPRGLVAFFFWGLAVVVAVGQVLVLGSNVSLCLPIKMQIKIFNSIKTKGTLS